jgi:hypothetical protein
MKAALNVHHAEAIISIGLYLPSHVVLQGKQEI